MKRLAPIRVLVIFVYAFTVVFLNGCGSGSKAPDPTVFEVTNASIQIPSEVVAGQEMVVKGEFELVSASKNPVCVVQVQVRRKTADGKPVIVASANVRDVRAEKLKRSFEVKIDAPEKPGEYEVIARALAKEAGKASFTVREH